jgi:hypothetical protein
MNGRTLTAGQVVRVGQRSTSIIAPASSNRQPCRDAVLVGPSPGGRFDFGTLWLVRYANGQEAVADESMMEIVGEVFAR